LDHEVTKQTLIGEGKAMGYGSRDMRVLSTDPYFVGSAKDYTDAEWVAKLWDKMMASRKKPLHLRGFHYWIQSQGIKKPDGQLYAHKDPTKDWGYLLHSAQIARYLGIGKWEKLMDLKHPEPSDYDSYTVETGLNHSGDIDIQGTLDRRLNGIVDSFLQSLVYESPRYANDYQEWHLEVWCEKSSMGMVIDPACKKYQATYQPLVGQSSVEKVNLAAQRAMKAYRAGKKVRIFYVADYDRYGWGMVSAVARKLEFMLQDCPDADVKLTRLALNDEHITKYNLPKAPKHGEAVVELDALEAIHPGELGKVIEKALSPYYETENTNIVESENQRMRREVKEMLEKKLRGPLEEIFAEINIDGIVGEGFNLTDVINPEFEIPGVGHEVGEDEERDWVYNSGLEYWEQIEEYKRYKDSRIEEAA